MGRINYYKESVEIEQAGQKDLDIVCKIVWPDLVRMEDIRGKDPQFFGIDRVAHLPGNATETIQAKIRTTTYDDVLLEYISNTATKSSGWMELPSLARHFLYIIMPKRLCYYFPWPQLQSLWNDNKREWIRFGEQEINGFKKIKAKNIGYYTISVAIPANILLDGIEQSRRIIYG